MELNIRYVKILLHVRIHRSAGFNIRRLFDDYDCDYIVWICVEMALVSTVIYVNFTIMKEKLNIYRFVPLNEFSDPKRKHTTKKNMSRGYIPFLLPKNLTMILH